MLCRLVSFVGSRHRSFPFTRNALLRKFLYRFAVEQLRLNATPLSQGIRQPVHVAKLSGNLALASRSRSRASCSRPCRSYNSASHFQGASSSDSSALNEPAEACQSRAEPTIWRCHGRLAIYSFSINANCSPMIARSPQGIA